MKHTISVLVENQSGVLARIAGLFSARAFNIDSLAVGETEDPTVSRMTIVSQGDERTVEQIMKQLNKLVDIIKVQRLNEEETIERELLLVKVSTGASNRAELMQIVNTFRAKVVDVSTSSLTMEVTGNQSKVDAMLELMRPFGIKEVARTGLIALLRGLDTNRKSGEKKAKKKAKKN
jgi:acetolactate synthase I/III small subunit